MRYSLTAITAPSLLVAGAYDLADFREIAQRLSRELPGATYVELDWAGHLPGLERPDEVNDLVLDFLRRHVGVPGPRAGGLTVRPDPCCPWAVRSGNARPQELPDSLGRLGCLRGAERQLVDVG